MAILKLIPIIYSIGLFSPLKLFKLFAAIRRYGINLMALLAFAGATYPEKTVLTDEQETLTYKQLFLQSEKLSIILTERFKLNNSRKVGFLCRNHALLIKSVFAVSLSGADIYLLNAEMSAGQFNGMLERNDFDLIIYDEELSPLIEKSCFNKEKIPSYSETVPAINNLLKECPAKGAKPRRSSSGKLMLLSGGTTGNFKEAAHKPSLFNFLNPWLALITRLNLTKYQTAYIATPIYHGYGIAILLLFISLGKKIVITPGFNVQKACSIVREHKVEVVTLVPLILHKMINYNPDDLKSLACIVSGGAELNPKLAEETLSLLGDVLYNLYGTSEVGLNMIATPQDLKYSLNTIGKKIHGAGLKILDENRKEVKTGRTGQFCIKNKWSMKNSRSSWIETGDLGYRDSKGYYFLCGRTDDMIVSAGENVYPFEVEQILKRHPLIEDAAVIGVQDEAFGQRLKAFILPAKNSSLMEKELFEWLHSNVARYQMPKEIVFLDSMPYTPLGKLDRKQLKVNC